MWKVRIGQLRAGFADGLGGDDADGLTHLDGLAGGQGESVGTRRLIPTSESSVRGDSTRTRVTVGSSRSRAHLVVSDDGPPLQHGCRRPRSHRLPGCG